jgi:hypothetical protein
MSKVTPAVRVIARTEIYIHIFILKLILFMEILYEVAT